MVWIKNLLPTARPVSCFRIDSQKVIFTTQFVRFCLARSASHKLQPFRHHSFLLPRQRQNPQILFMVFCADLNYSTRLYNFLTIIVKPFF